MEELERSKFTPAGKIANERLIEAVADPAVPLPADYRVEIRDRQLAAA